MIKENILQWMYENKILEKCMSNFWIAFFNYKKEEPDEFFEVIGDKYEKVKPIPLRISYDISFPDVNDPKYSIIFDICVDECVIGYYKEIYLPSGELFDDFFVID